MGNRRLQTLGLSEASSGRAGARSSSPMPCPRQASERPNVCSPRAPCPRQASERPNVCSHRAPCPRQASERPNVCSKPAPGHAPRPRRGPTFVARARHAPARPRRYCVKIQAKSKIFFIFAEQEKRSVKLELSRAAPGMVRGCPFLPAPIGSPGHRQCRF